jgi:hypothetical protein
VDLFPSLTGLQGYICVYRHFLSLYWHVTFQMVCIWCSTREIRSGIEYVFRVYCHRQLRIRKNSLWIFSTLTMGTLKLFHAKSEQNILIVCINLHFSYIWYEVEYFICIYFSYSSVCFHLLFIRLSLLTQ